MMPPSATESQADFRAAKVRRDHLEYKLRQLETELRGKAKEKLIEARLWLLEGDG